MSSTAKPIESLTSGDLATHPVWQLIYDDAAEEPLVRPLKTLPAKSLADRIVGTRVRLANGSEIDALLANIHTDDARLTELFLSLSVERKSKRFTLARYFDVDAEKRGPEALARFLRLSVDEVFPISYDIRKYARGDPASLAGVIRKEPRERLSRDEIIALAVP